MIISRLTKQTILVISITNLYMALGGIVFSLIEQKHITEICEEYKKDVAEKLPGIFLKIHESATSDQKQTGGIDFSPLIEMVERATNDGFKIIYKNGDKNETTGKVITGPSAKVICPNKWDYWNGILFSATVMTTIGYGSKSPVTTLGQFVYMLYSILGITLSHHSKT